MKKIITHLTFMLATVLCATACLQKEHPGPNNNNNPDDYFDFSTTIKADINLSYGTPSGYSFFFEIFDQDPLKQVELEGGMVDMVRDATIKAVAKGYTDAKGCYINSITIPANTSKLYVYSTAIGVEKMMNIDITNGIASAPYVAAADEPSSIASMTSSKTRSVDNYKTIGSWEDWGSKKMTIDKTKYTVYGRPQYIDDNKISVSASTLTAINNAFTNGYPVNKQYFQVTDINVTKEADIWLHLVEENTANNNVIGYYTYPTGQKPTSVSQITSTTIAIPNARIFANHNNFPKGNHGAMAIGEGVKLKYWDGAKFEPHFPAGISIGWVLNSDGYRFPRMGGSSERISKGYDYFYSQANLNPEASGEKNHLALFKYNDFVVFGFEDYYNNAGDGDCNDVVFHVKSNPVDAITDEIPEIEDPGVSGPTDEAYTTEYNGTLSFEDLWPYRGDYDMNDVVIKYHSVVSYNKLNEAIGTTDTFTLLWSGATRANGFAYQMNVDRANIELTIESNSSEPTPGLIENLDKANIVLFNDALAVTARNTKQATYVVKTKFKTPVRMGQFETAPYNPYVNINSSTAIELHLPGYVPTLKADTKYFGTGDDKSNKEKGIYYVSDLQYPFAINITGLDEFQIPKETVRIDVTYPMFKEWVKSQGKTNKDWYKHPIK